MNLGLSANAKHAKMIIFVILKVQHQTHKLAFNAALIPKNNHYFWIICHRNFFTAKKLYIPSKKLLRYPQKKIHLTANNKKCKHLLD
jgi:hypothetical protein